MSAGLFVSLQGQWSPEQRQTHQQSLGTQESIGACRLGKAKGPGDAVCIQNPLPGPKGSAGLEDATQQLLRHCLPDAANELQGTTSGRAQIAQSVEREAFN